MAKESNQLARHPKAIVAVRADETFAEVLAKLHKDFGFSNQSEVIYEAIYQLANRLGVKPSLGGTCPTILPVPENINRKLLHDIDYGTSTRRRQESLVAELAGQGTA